jgi:hypothetical protein
MAALVLDRTIVQQVIQRLTMRGLSAPCKIEVQSRNGEVTLTGPIQHAGHREASCCHGHGRAKRRGQADLEAPRETPVENQLRWWHHIQPIFGLRPCDNHLITRFRQKAESVGIRSF